MFYGLEEFLIDKEIKKIVEKEKFDDLDITKYDLENSNLKDIIDDASTVSLFSDKKAIIIDNSYIFAATTNKKYPEQNIELLAEYLNVQNSNTILIFKLNREKIDSRKKIVTQIKKIGKVVEFNKENNIQKLVLDMFKPYTINSSDLALFLDRIGNDLNIIEQEINKIKTYKDKDMTITRDDILNLTHKTIDIDIFDFIDNIINKKQENVIESYNEMIKMGEEPIKIIVMLANQIRIMYQAKELQKKGYMEKDIASLLDIHPYRVKLALSKSRCFTSEVLLNYLEQLANLDINIKTGKIDKELGLEMFLLSVE